MSDKDIIDENSDSEKGVESVEANENVGNVVGEDGENSGVSGENDGVSSEEVAAEQKAVDIDRCVDVLENNGEEAGNVAAAGEKKLSVKIFSIACTVLTALIIALTCYVLISMITARAKNRPVNLFGTSYAIVLTDSMEPEIMTGDLIFFRNYDFDKIREGDVIVFIAGNGFDEDVRGKNIVHKVVTVTPDGLVTKGVHYSNADADLVTADNFLGLCTGHSAFWGAFFTFMSKFGILILIVLFAVPFIISQIVKIVKLSKHSGEEDEDVNPPTEQK